MHPRQMMDGELDSLLEFINKSTRLIDFNLEQTKVLTEWVKRQEFIKENN